ncbi:MAG: SprB repeat-containing protein, partial [Phaeodactylibacter sp.]|nr:SprB repeat-containing protein [Phaeodactylibacter sp.]
PEGPQPAHVVYRFESEGLQLQHPVAASIATPGEPLKVIWNKRDGGADFALSYRKAGTSSWTAIANNVSGHNWQYNWDVPVLLSGIYELRLSHGAETVISEPFVILGKPGFYIEPTGLNTAIVHWEAVEEATQYEVLALGEEYMESLGVTEGLSLPITIAQGSANWFSVQAKKGTANSGSRSRAQFYRQSVCNNEALLKLHLDDKPHETSWALIDESGQQLIVAGPYPANMAGAILEIPLCLPDGCFTLSIQDSGNDGLCCEDGAGQYELYNGQGHLLAESSHFGGSGTTFFCMESNQPTLQAFATGAATVSCHGATDGWAVAYTSGGTGVYSYQWSNGETSPEVENLSAGVHKVTISDQVTSVVSVVYIAEPAPLSAVIATEDSGCGSVGTGAVSAMVSGGTAPYQYIWSTGDTGQELQEVPVGVYGVTVYDNKGCTVSATAQVLDASPLALYMAGDNPTCADEPDGAVFVSVIGGYPPYQYEWSNGSIISSAFDLSAGSYQLTVTDAMGCSATGQVELISPEPMSTTITYSDSLSYMEVSVSGGVPPYTYQWSDGSTASVLTINESDIYLLTITDANGCEYTLSEEVPSEAPEHCTPEVSTNFYTWIEAVKLDTAMRYTGQNEAPYASFESVENQRFDVRAGQPYTMTLYPGFQGYTLPVYWRVWVDLNEDGDFDDEGEQRYHSGQQAADSIVLAFQLPPDVEPGLKTMRISQSFLTPPDPCGG